RRPDRLTVLVGVAVLALAFFVLPTRVHERYLFPLVAVGAILAAVSPRWRIAYVISGAAMFANMYVVLTTWYTTNPNIHDWLGIGKGLASFWGIAIASLAQAGVLVWALLQLRGEAIESLGEDVADAGREARGDLDDDRAAEPGPVGPAGPPLRWPSPAPERAFAVSAMAASGTASAAAGGRAATSTPAAGSVYPAWDAGDEVVPLGPWAWLKARLADTPIRGDRSRVLDRERGGRLDRLDIWVMAVLAISLLTVRMWRLDEPYQMHFDEVYHPRTATEFLQDWRYGIPPLQI